MKLAWRLGALFVAGVWLVLAVFTYIRWQRESRLFDSDMRRDHRVLAVTLAPAVVQAWDEDGEAVANALLRRVDAARGGVSIRWVSLRPGAPPEWQPAAPLATIQPVLNGSLVQVQTERDGSAETHLLTYANASLQKAGPGALEIAEDMSGKTAYIADTLRNALLQSLAIALVCGVMAMAIGVHVVGRPVEALREKARRLGAGDPDRSRGRWRDDEFGDLARELDLAADHLEDQRRRALSELEVRLETAEQLRHAERLTTVGKLASALAHELGTPLNVISGHAQLIARGRVDNEEARLGAAAIVEQCSRMTALVRNLLDYARRKSSHRTLTDLAMVVRETGELLTPLARGRGVELKVETPASAALQVAPDQLRQALTNLVVNGIQASEPGGEVTLSLAEETVARDAGPRRGSRDRCYVVTVEDRGAGIAAQDLARVFEPFFTTKPSGEGTGLGLSITQDIVAEHGGWLAVDSEVGRGSRFRVFLPANQP